MIENNPGQSKPVSFLIIGAGDRGFTYSSFSMHFPYKMKIVGIAEPDKSRRMKFAEEFEIDKKFVFEDYESAFEVSQFADAAIIATPDNLHFEPAILAIKAGYAVLLEKPISNTLDECIRLNSHNTRYDGFTAVCHVLRYTRLFSRIRETIDSGKIGEVMSIEHIEGVGWWHQAHSFVRGNWRNTNETSPMILAKSCHDMDLLLWLSGKHAKKIASFGSLNHFTKSNAPAGSTERCTDCCPVESECPYSALKLYMNMDLKGWPVSTITNDLSYEGRLRALKEGPYGRCVYKCDNSAVDHQVVSIEFEGGATASFTMSAFTKPGRKIRVMGTMGEIRADEKIIEITDFRNGKTDLIDLSQSKDDIASGHGGGDFGLISAFVDAISQNDTSLITSTLDVSLESHMMAFAAEESRLTGRIIEL